MVEVHRRSAIAIGMVILLLMSSGLLSLPLAKATVQPVTVAGAAVNTGSSLTATVSLVGIGGTNRLIIVGLVVEDVPPPGGGAVSGTAGGVPLTLIQHEEYSGSANPGFEIWYVNDPPTGDYDVVMALNVNNDWKVAAIVFANARDFDTVPAYASGNSGIASAIGGSVTQGLVLDVVANGATTGTTMTPALGQTTQWNSGGGLGVPDFGGSTRDGTGDPITMSWSFANNEWGIYVLNIRPLPEQGGPIGGGGGTIEAGDDFDVLYPDSLNCRAVSVKDVRLVAANAILYRINWGDGTPTETLSAGPFPHTYTGDNDTYRVTIVSQDKSGAISLYYLNIETGLSCVLGNLLANWLLPLVGLATLVGAVGLAMRRKHRIFKRLFLAGGGIMLVILVVI